MAPLECRQPCHSNRSYHASTGARQGPASPPLRSVFQSCRTGSDDVRRLLGSTANTFDEGSTPDRRGVIGVHNGVGAGDGFSVLWSGTQTVACRYTDRSVYNVSIRPWGRSVVRNWLSHLASFDLGCVSPVPEKRPDSIAVSQNDYFAWVSFWKIWAASKLWVEKFGSKYRL